MERRATKTQELVLELRVEDVMTTDVITVSPEEKTGSLRDLLRDNRISGVPVVAGDRLVGIVSLNDFVAWAAEGRSDCEIGTRMTRDVEVLRTDDPLVRAVGRFDALGLGRFPVLEPGARKVVGILTKGDVIKGLLHKLEVDFHRHEEELYRHRASYIFEDMEADSSRVHLEYEVAGRDFEQAGRGASRLKRTLKRLGIRPAVVRRVAIASYEAEMNLVVFTEGGQLRATVEPSEILVEVEDWGPGMASVEEALRPGWSTAPDWVRDLGFGAGMGLCNIRNMSDVFDIDSEPGRGTLLRATFHLGEDGNEAD